MDTTVKRGDIFYADLSPVVGSEQGGTRPVLIVQNDTGNKQSPTVIAAAITSQTNKAKLPTHIELEGKNFGLTKNSVVLLEQIRTIDKRRLREHMGRLDEGMMNRVDTAIAVSFGLPQVMVPVLSRARQRRRRPCSRNIPPLTSMPLLVAAAMPLTTLTGVEITRAQGQPMTRSTRAV